MIRRLDTPIVSVVILAIAFAVLPAIDSVQAAASELFFSEYIEGTSFNKAVEIYNGTGSTVNLAGYVVELYSNGAASPSQSLTLSMLQPHCLMAMCSCLLIQVRIQQYLL